METRIEVLEGKDQVGNVEAPEDGREADTLWDTFELGGRKQKRG